MDPVRPSDPLARTGHVFGVITETRGAAPALNGAIRQRLGFRLPVWHTGGMGSLPPRLHIEQEMHEWAERTGAEAHLLLITDYDPSGLIIANAVSEEVRDVDVRRLGMWPHQAPSSAVTSIPKDNSDHSHRLSRLWVAAADEHGEDEYQAEAVEYAGWAELVADAVEEHIDLEDAKDEYGPEWDDGDRLMAWLRDQLADADGDPAAMLDNLEEAA